jgi:hypothetical protein
MVRVPAGVDAATVMELLAVRDRTPRDRTPEELPAEPVGVAVLCLGDAAVGCGRPGEQPAGAEFRMGRSEDREVNQAFQLGATPLGPPWILAQLGHGGECMTRPGHSGGAYPQPVTKEKAERWTSWRAFAQVRHGSNIELLPFSLVPVTDTSYLSSCSFAYCLGSRHGLASVGGGEGGGFAGQVRIRSATFSQPWSSMRSWPIPGTAARAGPSELLALERVSAARRNPRASISMGRGAVRHRATAAGPRNGEEAVSLGARGPYLPEPTRYGSGVRGSRSRCGCGPGGPRRRSRVGGRRRTASRPRRAAAGPGARPATAPGCGRRGCAG